MESHKLQWGCPTLCDSYANTHRGDEFLLTTAVLCCEDSLAAFPHSLCSPALCTPSLPLWPWAFDTDVLLGVNHSPITDSPPFNKLWVSVGTWAHQSEGELGWKRLKTCYLWLQTYQFCKAEIPFLYTLHKSLLTSVPWFVKWESEANSLKPDWPSSRILWSYHAAPYGISQVVHRKH